MSLAHDEILQTLRMLQVDNLDIRTTTLGINLLDCAGGPVDQVAARVYEKLVRHAGPLVATARGVEAEFGIPIVNKRIAVTPMSLVASACPEDDLVPLAVAMDRAADACGIDFIGGFSALVHKGTSRAARNLMQSIPRALASTKHVCASVNLGTTRAGINMDATLLMARVIKETAALTADQMKKLEALRAKADEDRQAAMENARAQGDFEGVREAMAKSYPIHPELFRRLYDDWSTLDKFQRTRGVLRLMAAVIHSLWEKGDRNPLIMPANLAIDDPRVQQELTRYLSDNWVPVIEKDVDGANSLPLRLDSEVANLGKFAASRRVARTIYLGSAPTTTAANRGLEDRRGLRAGVAHFNLERLALGRDRGGEPVFVGDADPALFARGLDHRRLPDPAFEVEHSDRKSTAHAAANTFTQLVLVTRASAGTEIPALDPPPQVPPAGPERVHDLGVHGIETIQCHPAGARSWRTGSGIRVGVGVSALG